MCFSTCSHWCKEEKYCWNLMSYFASLDYLELALSPKILGDFKHNADCNLWLASVVVFVGQKSWSHALKCCTVSKIEPFLGDIPVPGCLLFLIFGYNFGPWIQFNSCLVLRHIDLYQHMKIAYTCGCDPSSVMHLIQEGCMQQFWWVYWMKKHWTNKARGNYSV